jgi:hypothetical protein
MKRRKFLIGAGSLAAGGAAALGSGAFTSVQADRSVDVTVAGDANAFLEVEPAETDNAAAFTEQAGGRSNTLSIRIDKTAVGGSGVNEQAETFIDDLFSITNQGTQPVWVWMKSTIPGVNFYNSDDNEVISIDSGFPKNAGFGDREVIQYVTVGDGFTVGLSINTIGTPFDRDGQSTIIADAEESSVPDNNGLSVENSDKGV